MRAWILTVVVALAPLGACGDDEGGGSADDVIEAWKAAGLQPSAFEAADGKKLGGGKCRAGSIGGIEATLCEYADPTAARAAEGAGWDAVGNNTGIARAEGKVLLVIADRKNADHNGKRLQQIALTFSKRAR